MIRWGRGRNLADNFYHVLKRPFATVLPNHVSCIGLGGLEVNSYVADPIGYVPLETDCHLTTAQSQPCHCDLGAVVFGFRYCRFPFNLTTMSLWKCPGKQQLSGEPCCNSSICSVDIPHLIVEKGSNISTILLQIEPGPHCGAWMYTLFPPSPQIKAHTPGG